MLDFVKISPNVFNTLTIARKPRKARSLIKKRALEVHQRLEKRMRLDCSKEDEDEDEVRIVVLET
jgi:hypothetical protein